MPSPDTSGNPDVPIAVISSVIRSIESNPNCAWRTHMGMMQFKVIVEDVIEATLRCPVLHKDCAKDPDLIQKLNEFRTELTFADELIEEGNKTILELERKIQLLQQQLEQEK